MESMLVRVECIVCLEEMNAHGDQASMQLCCKSREEPSRKPCESNRVIQLTNSDRGHMTSSNYFSSFRLIIQNSVGQISPLSF